ncbi:hypothetical protein AZ78_3412 [Lysobacter capsici AZ78]|uniref:Uncharacterized protein n=1 Tax=Lysobacter capsici AZ78 TaxID=1444315 RepID=A0A108UB05_9GAMM|nr:hypothetical protein AZ78_3412 [Lysobacter capsici AZ78]
MGRASTLDAGAALTPTPLPYTGEGLLLFPSPASGRRCPQGG